MRTNKQKNFKMNDLFDNNNNNKIKDNETNDKCYIIIIILLLFLYHSKWIQAIKLKQTLILL